MKLFHDNRLDTSRFDRIDDKYRQISVNDALSYLYNGFYITRTKDGSGFIISKFGDDYSGVAYEAMEELRSNSLIYLISHPYLGEVYTLSQTGREYLSMDNEVTRYVKTKSYLIGLRTEPGDNEKFLVSEIDPMIYVSMYILHHADHDFFLFDFYRVLARDAYIIGQKYFTHGFFEKYVTAVSMEYYSLSEQHQSDLYREHIKKFSVENIWGYVYLVQGGGYYKIGKANNVEKRVQGFSPKYPFDVEVIHQILCFKPLMIEKMLHKRFEAQRIKGEWFHLSATDIDYIKSL